MNADEVLGQVTIPSPCPANWDSMTGDRRVRFCQTCGKSVLNFAAMTKEQAASAVVTQGDNLCARVTIRKDGSIITKAAPTQGPWRFRLSELMSTIAWIAACLGFARFMASSAVIAGSVRRAPVSPSAPTPPSCVRPAAPPPPTPASPINR